MSNLHRDLDELNLHNPKGFSSATNNTFATKNEQGSSYYEERMQLPKVINIVDGNLPAPSTADLDAFIIIDGGGGVVDASWGASLFNDWVRFNGTVPSKITPLAGYLAYDENGSQWKEFDGTNWVDFGGGGVVDTLYTADGTLTGARTVGTGGNTLSFVAANGTQTVEPVEIITGGNTSPFDAFLIKKPNGFRLFDVDGDGLGIMTQAVQDVSLTIDSFGGSAQSDALLVRSSSSTTFFRSVNSGKVAIGETISTILNSGSVASAAVLNVGGKGSTSATTALLVQNSLGTNLLEVKDNGGVNIGTQTADPNALLTVEVPAATGVGTVYKDSTQNLTVIGRNGAGLGEVTIYGGGSPKFKFFAGGTSYVNNGSSFVVNGTTGAAPLNVYGFADATVQYWYDRNSDSCFTFLSEINNNRFDLFNYGGASVQHRLRSDGNNSYINGITSANLGVGLTAPTAKLHVKGTGSTSGTTALLVQNSLSTNLLEVLDDGSTTINGTTSVKNAGSTGTTVFKAEGIGTFPLMKVSTENDAFRPLFTLSNPNTGVNFVKLSGWTDNYIASNIGFGFTSGEAASIDSNFRIHSNGRIRVDSSGSHTNSLIEIGQDPLDAIRPELLMSISTTGTGVVRFGGSAAANYVAGNTGFGFDSTTSAGISAKLHVNGSTLLDGNLGLFGTTPIAQPTTAGGSALLGTGGGTGLTDLDTFDGYTLQQVVKALRDLGILA